MPASNRGDFQALAEERLADAASLLAAQRWSAAYYLAGYAVECGLKACIAKLTREYDFPPRNVADIYTHNLERLVQTAELQVTLAAAMAADHQLKDAWAIVKDWKEDARYDINTQAEAEEMYERTRVVMNWVRQQW